MNSSNHFTFSGEIKQMKIHPFFGKQKRDKYMYLGQMKRVSSGEEEMDETQTFSGTFHI